MQVNVTNDIGPPSKLLLALEGGRASLEQALGGALGGIPEASHYIRKLWATDQDAFCNHLLRLDVDGRYDRFAMGVSDDFIRKYAELCFTMPGSIFGYFSDDGLRGAGELRLMGDRGTAAEAAFSVEPGWRRRGIGRELMTHIVQAASNARVTTLYMSCLASNRAMQKLAKHFEADIKFEANQVTGRMIGRPPTIASQWEERLEDAASLATSLVELHRRQRTPLANEALRRNPDLKVLFTTGFTRNAVVHDGVRDPGTQLISKPFTLEQWDQDLRGNRFEEAQLNFRFCRLSYGRGSMASPKPWLTMRENARIAASRRSSRHKGATIWRPTGIPSSVSPQLSAQPARPRSGI